jgi:hypothetical protein
MGFVDLEKAFPRDDITIFAHAMDNLQPSPASDVLQLLGPTLYAIRELGFQLGQEKGADLVANELCKAAMNAPRGAESMAEAVALCALRIYTKETVIDDMNPEGLPINVGFLYREVNRRLRSIEGLAELDIAAVRDALRAATGDLCDLCLLIWDGLKRVPVERLERPSVLFRGIRLPGSAFEQWAAAAGRIVAIPNFSSFSDSVEVATGFLGGATADDVRAMITLEAKVRRPIDQFATMAVRGEFEVLLPPLTVVDVANVEFARTLAGGQTAPAKIFLRQISASMARMPSPAPMPPAGASPSRDFGESAATEFAANLVEWFGPPASAQLL